MSAPPDITPQNRLARVAWLAERCRSDMKTPEVIWFARRALERFEKAPPEKRTRELLAAIALELVRGAFRFVRHPSGRNVFKSPSKLVTDGEGECADTAPFLAAVYAALGLRAALSGWSVESGFAEHLVVLVEVRDGDWRIADPTLMQAWLGEDPYEAAERLQLSRADLGRDV